MTAPSSNTRAINTHSTDSMRKTALAGGVFYLITFAASFPALALKGTFLDNADFILGTGSDTAVLWSGVLEMINALAAIGTAVVLYRFGKRHSETAAIGFLASRILEAAIIAVGVVTLFATVALRRDLTGNAGTDTAALKLVGHSLVAINKWAFLLGPGVMAGINALCLGTVMYRSKLVPRVIPLMGLIGAPLILTSDVAVMLRLYNQLSPISVIATLPIALWEFSLGVWLVVKGFQPARARSRR
jgi:hypothetical protein